VRTQTRIVRRLSIVVLAAFVAGALATPLARAVQQTPLFHSSTETVAIYATAIDRDRHLITNLTRDDFEVRDNGKPVDLTVFSADPAPITIGILLDTSGSMRDTLPTVVTATEQLIGKLLPADEAQLGVFGDKTVMSPDFTSNHDTLLRFLHAHDKAGGETPLWNTLDLSMVHLKDVPGRRVVLVFTDGFDSTTLEHGYAAVSKRADAEEVMVYAIGCWGGPDSGDDKPDPNLRKLADRTGGGYTELTRAEGPEIAATFTRIAEELHHQYVLGFVPTKLDGKSHDLQVKVRRANITVRARKTYVAEAGGR
jgi:Ca-activated chloride channel family protein